MQGEKFLCVLALRENDDGCDDCDDCDDCDGLDAVNSKVLMTDKLDD